MGATWNDPVATWADLNVAWDGSVITGTTQQVGGLGRRGPYESLEVQMHRRRLAREDEELSVIL